jgi:hypothetical protein
MRRLLTVRIRFPKPDTENYYFILALNPTSWPKEGKVGFFIELFKRRMDVYWEKE